jgi:hypothetical protein
MMLDYSSGSALLGSLIVVAVTMLSTAYPAYRAMTVAVPKGEEEDRPEFSGTRMTSILPFTLTGRHAAGGVGFLYDFILEHDEMIGAESFFVRSPSLTQEKRDGRIRFDIRFDMWLPPIDLGNSQRAHIWTETDQHDIMYLHVDAERRTGEEQSWRMCNLAFIGILRRQMLLWRMVEEHRRDTYVEMAMNAPDGSEANRDSV